MLNNLHNTYAKINDHIGIISHLKFDDTYYFSDFETGEYFQINLDAIQSISINEYKQLYNKLNKNDALFNNIVQLRSKGVTSRCKNTLEFCRVIADLRLEYLINNAQLPQEEIYRINHKFYERLSQERVCNEEIMEVIQLYEENITDAAGKLQSINNKEFHFFYGLPRNKKPSFNY